MGYRQLIDNSLRRAFIMAKDLAVDVIFVRVPGTTFDFSTSETTSESVQNLPIKIIWLEAKKTSKETNFTKKSVMFERKSIGDVTEYDSINDNGNIWKIGKPLKDDGYITILEVYKEL